MDSTISKFELNNQIVQMRHNVNRAKVQTIAKMVRHIRLLRNKKTSDVLKAKNEEKANRLMNELLVIKKIPHDEISAFSLSNSKSIKSVLSDVNSSYHLKGLARLSAHKSIVPIVEMFHTKYPNWQKEVPRVLIALKTGEKLKLDGEGEMKNPPTKKGKKRQKGKKEIKNSVDDNLSDQEDKDGFVLADFSDGSVSENDISEGNVKEDSFIMSKGNRFSVSSDDTELSSVLKGTTKAKKKKMSQDEFTCDENVCSKSGSDSDYREDEIIDNTSLTHSSNRTSDRKPNRISEISNRIKNKDPFFLGSDDQEYETCNPIVSSAGEFRFLNKDTVHFNSSFKNTRNVKSFQDNVNQKHGNKQSNFKDSFKKRDKFNSSNKGSVDGAKQRVNKVSGKSQDKPVSLHPSWEAKKKLSSILPFTGQKIVF